ncbi:MAG TPA: NADH-quinone oxidoreductase subunit C, partial [Nitrospirota bacterium]|nr:NADH-quinone oxidoreductase subunit C [Nitrospirota bacterium]
MTQNRTVIDDLKNTFGEVILAVQPTRDDIPTVWVSKDRVNDVLRLLKNGINRPYKMLYDLTAIDERVRTHTQDQPESDFTVVYHLLSFDRNEDIRVKVPLVGVTPSLPTITGIWPSANWYEREAWDLFGIRFDGHPRLRRILMPPTWE